MKWQSTRELANTWEYTDNDCYRRSKSFIGLQESAAVGPELEPHMSRNTEQLNYERLSSNMDSVRKSVMIKDKGQEMMTKKDEFEKMAELNELF